MPNYSSSYTGTLHDEYVTKQALIDLVYPVGSFYMSSSSTSPATLFGGTWELIKDTFILAAGDTYTAGDIGGNTKHTHTYSHTHTTPATTTESTTLTIAQVPSHRHWISAMAWDDGNCSSSGSANSLDNGLAADAGSYSANDTCKAYGRYDAWAGGSNGESGKGSSKGTTSGHTHGQVATTTNSQSTTTTSETSNMPPYLVAYIWKRTA